MEAELIGEKEMSLFLNPIHQEERERERGERKLKDSSTGFCTA